MRQASVFIADDHPITLAGLGMLIDAETDLSIVAKAANGDEAWNLVDQHRPEVAILDISLPLIDGFELTRLFRERGLPTKVLMLTQHEDRAHLRQAMDAGACGYVLKRSAAQSIIGAIRGVRVGGLYIDPLMMAHVFPRAPRQNDSSMRQLTFREVEVLKGVAIGKTAKEISEDLDVSVSSVETYKARAIEKLNIKSRAEIVSYASSQGWMTGA